MDEFRYKQTRLLKRFLDGLTEELSNSGDTMAKIVGKSMLSMKGDFIKRMEKSEKMREDFDKFIEQVKVELDLYQKEGG